MQRSKRHGGSGMAAATAAAGAAARHDALRAALAPLGFLLAALLVRGHAFPYAALDLDEGLYLVQAAAWLEGRWPFVAIWDLHPPGAPALLALAMLLVPDPILALRLTGLVAVVASATLLHALLRRLGADAATAFAAGLLLVGHSAIRGGLPTNTELLFAPFVLLAALLLLGEGLRAAPPRAAVVLAAGLAAGIALWIKQVAAFECSALWLTMAVLALRGGHLLPRRVPGLAAVFAVGAAAPTVGIAAGYAAAGQLGPWMQGNVHAVLAYAGEATTAPGWLGAAQGTTRLATLVLPALGVVLAGPATRRRAAMLLPWLAGATLAVVLPGKFYDHYMLILVPPLSALGALGLAALVRRAAAPAGRAACFTALVALLAAVPSGKMVVARLAAGPPRAEEPVRAVSRLVADALPPGETFFVANWSPLPYLLVGRAPPTRFPFPPHLAGDQAGLTGVDADRELARVLDLPPAIVVVATGQGWASYRAPARAAIEARLARDYVRIGSVPDYSGPVEIWALAAARPGM